MGMWRWRNQQNRDHQCRNFDVVDSGWTLAVVAALLLDAGSGPVFPAALASAATGD